jgi:hypothetical protein
MLGPRAFPVPGDVARTPRPDGGGRLGRAGRAGRLGPLGALRRGTPKDPGGPSPDLRRPCLGVPGDGVPARRRRRRRLPRSALAVPWAPLSAFAGVGRGTDRPGAHRRFSRLRAATVAATVVARATDRRPSGRARPYVFIILSHWNHQMDNDPKKIGQHNNKTRRKSK